MSKLEFDTHAKSNCAHALLLAPEQLILLASLIGAVAARLIVRIAFGQEYFWTNSYSIYYTLAENLVAGKGFCLRSTCAWLPPLYPLFLIPSVLAGAPTDHPPAAAALKCACAASLARGLRFRRGRPYRS